MKKQKANFSINKMLNLLNDLKLLISLKEYSLETF